MNEDKVLDVREMPCSVKHPLIVRTWYELPVNDYFILVNHHDPVPLYHQFAAEFQGAISWEYLERGPDQFRIKITKLASVPSADLVSPCGGH